MTQQARAVLQATDLQQRIDSGQTVLLAEVAPPCGVDPSPLCDAARALAGRVDAIGVSDNRERVAMSALAAAALVRQAGVEPVLHVTTRDRNRIALVSEALGAQALGVRNLLCTSGSHQTLGPFRAARNVYDLDSVQLLATFARLADDAAVVGVAGFAGAGPFCLGGVAAPFADPLELQVGRLAKKAAAGAAFLVTHPVYDLERFAAWWQAVTRRGIHEKVAVLAGVQPLTGTALEQAQARAAAGTEEYPVPAALLQRVAGHSGAAQRAAALEVAVETIGRLSALSGLRGYSLAAEGDAEAIVEVLDAAGLRSR